MPGAIMRSYGRLITYRVKKYCLLSLLNFLALNYYHRERNHDFAFLICIMPSAFRSPALFLAMLWLKSADVVCSCVCQLNLSRGNRLDLKLDS